MVLLQLSVSGKSRAWQLYDPFTAELVWANEGDLLARAELPFANKVNRRLTRIVLPLSTPILVVATILQVTGIWNDFIFGLTFAGRDNLPMTVQLNNIVNSTQGERLYNVDMAATMLTGIVPLVVYFVSGRWFVRGIAARAVKG